MSSNVLERPIDVASQNGVRDLLVLWQHPKTRAIIVVGRLQYDGFVYDFDYTRGAAAIDGFRPFLGLSDLREHYQSEKLFPVFAQRVMGPGRPDYEDYLSRLGLDPEHASPWEQIVRSGGSRAGDTLQFMQVPRVERGRVSARFFVNGVRHIPGKSRSVNGKIVETTRDQLEEAIGRLRVGDDLTLLLEDDNPKSIHATLVANTSRTALGYVPEVLAYGVRELLKRGPVNLRVGRVNGPDAPAHLRLVADLTAVAPGFAFDPDCCWDPIQG